MDARTAYAQTHYVSSLDKIPNHAHYAILIEETRSSRDLYDNHPDGSPKFTSETILQYAYFDSQEALEAYILDAANAQNYFSRKKYKVIHVSPVEVTLKTEINVKKQHTTHNEF